jgi:hypothetical protein
MKIPIDKPESYAERSAWYAIGHKRSLAVRGIVWSVVLILILAAFTWPISPFIFGTAVFFAASFILYYLYLFRTAESSLCESLSALREIDILDTGVCFIHENKTSSIQWAQFSSIFEDEDFLILKDIHGYVALIPKSPDASEVRDMVSSHFDTPPLPTSALLTKAVSGAARKTKPKTAFLLLLVLALLAFFHVSQRMNPEWQHSKRREWTSRNRSASSQQVFDAVHRSLTDGDIGVLYGSFAPDLKTQIGMAQLADAFQIVTNALGSYKGVGVSLRTTHGSSWSSDKGRFKTSDTVEALRFERGTLYALADVKRRPDKQEWVFERFALVFAPIASDWEWMFADDSLEEVWDDVQEYRNE